MLLRFGHLGIFLFLCFTASFISEFAEAKPLTLFHTNDLHSHFQPDRTHPYGLGGVARIATLLRRLREQNPVSLLLDGGDWSEGHAYYNIQGGGTSAIQIMNTLQYDVAVLGNHDFLNGPEQLLKRLSQSPPSFKILAANVDFSPAKNSAELQGALPSFALIEKGGLRIGVIGVATFEFIYDRYLAPARILYPFPIVKKIARELKTIHHADVVIVISHNNLSTNKLMAIIPNVDVVIHSHDHEFFNEPIEMVSNGKTSWIVEAGKWGHFLGQLELDVDPQQKTVQLLRYKLHQIDEEIPEDSTISSMIHVYEETLKRMYRKLAEPQLFEDSGIISEVDISEYGGHESLLGNALADAYRVSTGADFAFEQIKLTSGVLRRTSDEFMFPGFSIRNIDLMNTIIQIFNPETQKTWTVWTMKMQGAILHKVLGLLFLIQDLIPGGLPSCSGLHVVYDSNAHGSAKEMTPEEAAKLAIRRIEVGGTLMDMDKVYTLATTNGILHSLEFIEKKLGLKVERTELKDSGLESWKVLRNHLQSLSPIQKDSISLGGRFEVMKPDLALYPQDIEFLSLDDEILLSPFHGYSDGKTVLSSYVTLKLRAHVHNYGAVESKPSVLTLGYDPTPEIYGDKNNIQWFDKIDLPKIKKGGQQTIVRTLHLPLHLYSKKKISLTFNLNDFSLYPYQNASKELISNDFNKKNDRLNLVWSVPRI